MLLSMNGSHNNVAVVSAPRYPQPVHYVQVDKLLECKNLLLQDTIILINYQHGFVH